VTVKTIDDTTYCAAIESSGKFLTRTSMAGMPAFDTKKFGPIVSGAHRRDRTLRRRKRTSHQ
jgi:hypothetical protein